MHLVHADKQVDHPWCTHFDSSDDVHGFIFGRYKNEKSCSSMREEVDWSLMEDYQRGKALYRDPPRILPQVWWRACLMGRLSHTVVCIKSSRWMYIYGYVYNLANLIKKNIFEVEKNLYSQPCYINLRPLRSRASLV